MSDKQCILGENVNYTIPPNYWDLNTYQEGIKAPPILDIRSNVLVKVFNVGILYLEGIF